MSQIRQPGSVSFRVLLPRFHPAILLPCRPSPIRRHHLHELVDQLDERQIDQAAQALETIRQNALLAVLRDIPGLRVSDHWPPRYRDVEPLTVPGEPASEPLIRERNDVLLPRYQRLGETLLDRTGKWLDASAVCTQGSLRLFAAGLHRGAGGDLSLQIYTIIELS